MIRRFFQRSNNTKLLGRWQIDDNRSEIRAAMANVDSCGDSLCGNPEMLKNSIIEIDKKVREYEEELKKKELAKQKEEKNFLKNFR